MVEKPIWIDYEMKDAQQTKRDAALSGNLHAVLAAEEWILAIRAATSDEATHAEQTCKSIAPHLRQRAIECLGHHNNGGR
jgi:hypothetical protein